MNLTKILGMWSASLIALINLNHPAWGQLAITTLTTSSSKTHSATPAAQSWSMILSPDDTFGIFHSQGLGVTADQIDSGVGHLFHRNLLTEETHLITRSGVDQQPANGSSIALGISGNGRYLLALSDATNLTTNKTTGANNLFRLDLQTSLWQLVNHDTNLPSASGGVVKAEMTSDGRFVLFSSSNKGLIYECDFICKPITNRGRIDLYLADLETGEITLQNAFTNTSLDSYDHVTDFALAPDGKNAIYLVSPSKKEDRVQLVTCDLMARTNARPPFTALNTNSAQVVSVSPDSRFFFFARSGSIQSHPFFTLTRGEFGTTNIAEIKDIYPMSIIANTPMLSTPDGSSLFFATTNGMMVWRPNTTNTFIPVSPAPTNGKPSFAWPCAITEGGDKLLYASSVNLTGGLETGPHLYLADLASKSTVRITRSFADELPGDPFGNAIMDKSSTHIFFDSIQPGYTTNDLNGVSDIFAYDPQADAITLVTHKLEAGPEPRALGYTRMPIQSTSDDGSYAIFLTSIPGILEPFNTTSLSLIGQNLITGKRELLSVGADGLPLANRSVEDAMLSGDGEFVLLLTASISSTSASTVTVRNELILRDIKGKTNHLLFNAVGRRGFDPLVFTYKDDLQYALSRYGKRVVFSTNRTQVPMIYDLSTDKAKPAVLNLQGTTQDLKINA